MLAVGILCVPKYLKKKINNYELFDSKNKPADLVK